MFVEKVDGEIAPPDPFVVTAYRENRWWFTRRSQLARVRREPTRPSWRVTWRPREGRFIVEPSLPRFRSEHLAAIARDLEEIRAILPSLRS